jgi:hypothetical protein
MVIFSGLVGDKDPLFIFDGKSGVNGVVSYFFFL